MLSSLLYSLLFTYVKQKRFQNDMSINNNPVDVLQDQKWESIPWKKLQVGDIVRVSGIFFCLSCAFDGYIFKVHRIKMLIVIHYKLYVLCTHCAFGANFVYLSIIKTLVCFFIWKHWVSQFFTYFGIGASAESLLLTMVEILLPWLCAWLYNAICLDFKSIYLSETIFHIVLCFVFTFHSQQLILIISFFWEIICIILLLELHHCFHCGNF